MINHRGNPVTGIELYRKISELIEEQDRDREEQKKWLRIKLLAVVWGSFLFAILMAIIFSR